VRLLHTQNTGKSDPGDALSVAVAALRSPTRREVIADGQAVALKVWRFPLPAGEHLPIRNVGTETPGLRDVISAIGPMA
jgi:hypothetical protein